MSVMKLTIVKWIRHFSTGCKKHVKVVNISMLLFLYASCHVNLLHVYRLKFIVRISLQYGNHNLKVVHINVILSCFICIKIKS